MMWSFGEAAMIEPIVPPTIALIMNERGEFSTRTIVMLINNGVTALSIGNVIEEPEHPPRLVIGLYDPDDRALASQFHEAAIHAALRYSTYTADRLASNLGETARNWQVIFKDKRSDEEIVLGVPMTEAQATQLASSYARVSAPHIDIIAAMIDNENRTD